MGEDEGLVQAGGCVDGEQGCMAGEGEKRG